MPTHVPLGLALQGTPPTGGPDPADAKRHRRQHAIREREEHAVGTPPDGSDPHRQRKRHPGGGGDQIRRQ
ncbi:hypothetical protein GJ744_008725 [Endocarpon pusillum]|uniref:Uncharacterized protein n=1 Tax=Endocarpon pusillum TaxID=364733 RepID=A0A8H7EB49_9EURO|nr:hypothetical protein GJ744_008725 [Endocarpon pusillum]